MQTGTEQRLRRVTALRMPVVAYRRLRDRAYDAALGVNTTRAPAVDTTDAGGFGDGTRYEPIWYPLLDRFVRDLAPTREDVVYDVGSGLGRVLVAFARRGVGRAIGIEISPELAAIAERNARALRRRGYDDARIETRIADASIADYAGGTIYFMSNPFGARTLAAVMDGIARSIVAEPRRVRIAYCTPRHQSILRDLPWLAEIGRRRARFHRSTVSYWEHDPAVHAPPIVAGRSPVVGGVGAAVEMAAAADVRRRAA